VRLLEHGFNALLSVLSHVRALCNAANGARRRWSNKNSWLDKAAQEKSVKNSELDWVIFRPGTLNDLPARGPSACVVVDSMGGPIMAPELSRQDLAAFALDQCPGTDFIHKCPGISWREPPPS